MRDPSRLPAALALAAVPLLAAVGTGGTAPAPGAATAGPPPRAAPPAEAAPPADDAVDGRPRVLPVQDGPGAWSAPSSGGPIPDGTMPVDVYLPSLGVEAPLVPLGLEEDRSMQVPGDFDRAGWYVHGPRPGEPGAAVIVGHVDSSTGPAVFHRLGALRPGDPVHIRYDDGRRITFEVTGSRSHPKDAFPTGRVFAAEGPRLRLITCGGPFDRASGHYEDNLVVSARPAGAP